MTSVPACLQGWLDTHRQTLQFQLNAAQRSDLAFEFWTDEDEDADWDGVDSADAEADLAMYRRQVAAADAAVVGLDLNDVVPGLQGGGATGDFGPTAMGPDDGPVQAT